jgi:nucleotide-binding universal stress UspA family protein
MARVLACIDGSSYTNSVCDHAGWFASDPEIGVEVLHVVEPRGEEHAPSASPTSGDPLVASAVRRLREEGVGPVTSAAVAGDFVGVAVGRGAMVIVMGKRGASGDTERRRLGSSVDAMVRATHTPICLTSKLFLPIHRGLLLLDADLSHRSAVEFALAEPRLADLPIDVVVMAGADEDPGAKVKWAQGALNTESADVFPLPAEGLDDAVTRYMESRAADLIVVSRTVIAPDPLARLGRIEDRGLWGARTPVLIC